MRRFSTAAGVLFVALVMLALGSATASASVGSAEDEVTAYYQAFLQRAPEPGPIGYVTRIQEDCRWGILQAGYNIGDSKEMYDHNPAVNDKVTALFRGLLHRDPDPGGRTTYTNAVVSGGMRHAIMSMMASDEYQGRLNALCAGRQTSNVNVLSPEAAVHAAVGMMDAAKTEAAACSVGAIGTAANLILSAPADAGAAVAAIRGASFAVRAYASSPIAACWTTLQTIRTADRIVSLASWNDRDNGTFIGMHQWDVKKHLWDPRKCHVTTWYGDGPSHYDTTQVEFVC